MFARLINMEIEPFLLASSITGVLGLRLIRKNCQYCSVPYEPEPAMLRLLTPEQMEVAQFRTRAGCDHCLNTGFQGRTALTEMLVVDEVIRDSILQKVTDPDSAGDRRCGRGCTRCGTLAWIA